MPEPVAGVVLAGGRSIRMGADKSLEPLAGRPLIAHVAARLGPQVDAMIINANGDPRRFEFLDVPVVPDTVAGFAGPLAGVLSGLRWAEMNGFARVVTAATDTPFFPADLVDCLTEVAPAETIAMARCSGRAHPVFARWPVSAADAMENFLRSGENASVLKFAERCRHIFVDFLPVAVSGGLLDPFLNLNTPADLDRAERLAAEIGR